MPLPVGNVDAVNQAVNEAVNVRLAQVEGLGIQEPRVTDGAPQFRGSLPQSALGLATPLK